MLGPGRRIKRGFSAVYLGIFSGILLIILIINGLLEINRTKNGFYLLLEREAAVLIQYLEKDIQEVLGSIPSLEAGSERQFFSASRPELLFDLEESLAEYLLEAARRIDQMDREKSLTLSDLERLASQYLLHTIEIYDMKGNLLKSGPGSESPDGRASLLKDLIQGRRSVVIDFFGKPVLDRNWFSIAVLRRKNPEIIALHLRGEQTRRLFRQFAVQKTISEMGALREGIRYISVLDGDLQILGHSDPAFIGRKEDASFLRSSLPGNHTVSRLYSAGGGEEIFEVVKPFSLNGRPMGLIRVGYSSKEVRPLLNEIRKNVALSVLFFLVLGVAAISLTWINQNRHLKGIKEMEARVQLAERLSSLGHLAAGVAHEIRNPLNAIGMGLQRLKREFLPQEESRREEYLSFADLISKEIRRVNEIIEQFLSLARPFQLNLRPGSPEDLLGHLATLLQEEASSLGIQIRTEIDSNLHPIKMDEEKLTQALINIMKNGMQAMERGGTLRLAAQSFKDRLEISVIDSGSGIPPERMEKIFNYYYTTKEKGVGLGLPLAHRIIEAHGGQLRIESRVGSGTKVIVILPT